MGIVTFVIMLYFALNIWKWDSSAFMASGSKNNILNIFQGHYSGHFFTNFPSVQFSKQSVKWQNGQVIIIFKHAFFFSRFIAGYQFFVYEYKALDALFEKKIQP